MKNNLLKLCLLTTMLVLLCSCNVNKKDEMKSSTKPSKQVSTISDTTTKENTDNANEYKFEPNITRLEGKLITRMYYGRPNYGETPEKDEKEYPYILILDNPIKVVANKDDDFNKTTSGIKEVQIVEHEDLFQKYIGKRVKIEGTMFSGHTGHHHTEVLLEATKVIDSDNKN